MRMSLGEVRQAIRGVIVEMARAQDPVKAIKKLLQLPGDMEERKLDGITRLTWVKRGGHAGRKITARVEQAARLAGWQRGGRSSDTIPDGSRIGGSEKWHDAAGNELSISDSYGGVAADNRFSINVTVVNVAAPAEPPAAEAPPAKRAPRPRTPATPSKRRR